MSIKINVEVNALEQSANRMEEQCAAYEKSYHQLYQCVDEMRSAWQGEDNLAYVNQIRGFEQDFIHMVRLMRSYAEFLRSSARTYRATQAERVNQARALTK